MKKNITGIYAIINKTNNKRYIGSARSAIKRWQKEHLPMLKRNKHYNAHLQNAWNKYGEENFEFKVIEECDESLLMEREEHWIESYKSWERENGYNLTRIIEGRHIVSEETKQKMKKAAEDKFKDMYKDIIDLHKKGLGKNTIAKELGISRTTIYSCLEHNGLHDNTGKGTVVKLTDEVKEQIKTLREDGKTWDEIIQQVNISKTQLFRACDLVKDGKFLHPKRSSYRTITPEVVEKVDQLRKAGKSWTEIEVELGIGRSTFHRNGITQKYKPFPKGFTKVTEERKQEVKKLKAEGKSIKDIYLITGMPETTIRSHIK